MEIEQVVVFDVFCSDTLRGNPAAVFWLAQWPDDDRLRALAMMQPAPVTAFICVPATADCGVSVPIRWFAGAAEINLCGHGSLAAAALLFARQPQRQQVQLTSRFGDLQISRSKMAPAADLPVFAMRLPAWPAQRPAQLSGITAALNLPAQGLVLTDCFATRDLVLVLESAAQVQAFVADLETLRQLQPYHATIVTAPLFADDNQSAIGYVLRYFAPNIGINEDLATGSAQCSLAPYWLQRLDASRLQVRQYSVSGGYFEVEMLSPGQILVHAAVREPLPTAVQL